MVVKIVVVRKIAWPELRVGKILVPVQNCFLLDSEAIGRRQIC